MPNLQVWEIANEAWKNTKRKGGAVKKRCENCFNNWKSKGSVPEEKPPLFPLDFDKPCPVCGGELKGSFPF